MSSRYGDKDCIFLISWMILFIMVSGIFNLNIREEIILSDSLAVIRSDATSFFAGLSFSNWSCTLVSTHHIIMTAWAYTYVIWFSFWYPFEEAAATFFSAVARIGIVPSVPGSLAIRSGATRVCPSFCSLRSRHFSTSPSVQVRSAWCNEQHNSSSFLVKSKVINSNSRFFLGPL